MDASAIAARKFGNVKEERWEFDDGWKKPCWIPIGELRCARCGVSSPLGKDTDVAYATPSSPYVMRAASVASKSRDPSASQSTAGVILADGALLRRLYSTASVATRRRGMRSLPPSCLSRATSGVDLQGVLEQVDSR